MIHGQEHLESKITRGSRPFVAVGLLALADGRAAAAAGRLDVRLDRGRADRRHRRGRLLVPWSRLPRWTFIVPPLAYFVVVALLREANDGSVSGYAPLALLPVVWIALNLGRKEVALGIAVGSSVFVLPLLFGNPDSYTASDWRRAILWTGVALIVGFSVEAIMRDKRAQTRMARDHQRMIAAVAEVSRRLGAEEDCARAHLRAPPRDRGCDLRGDLGAGRIGDLVLTGHAGPELGRMRFRTCGELSGTPPAFASGTTYLVLRRPRRPDALSGGGSTNGGRLDAVRTDHPWRRDRSVCSAWAGRNGYPVSTA